VPVGKPDLVAAAADAADLSQAQAKKAVDAVFGAITEGLKKGDKVQLVGFGTFTVRKRAARTAKNPRTGEPVKVAAAKVPGFRAGAALKAAVKK